MAPKPSVLRAPPKKARPLTGRGALPSEKNLLSKSPEDLIRTLKRFNIEPDMGGIMARSRRAFERLNSVIAEGIAPDAATWLAIDQQLEKQVTQNLRQMVKAAVRNYKQARREEVADKATWVTLADGRVCPSCGARHGKTKTWKQWRAMGLPGSAALICRQECRCDLVPDVHA